MSDTTTIEWTATRLPDGTILPGYTFNPWRGCKKVSPACAHCYAESLSKRNPTVLGDWTPGAPRVIAADSYMRRPFLWNRAAEKSGIRMKVFCASMADVFEDFTGPLADVRGNPVPLTLDDIRRRLLSLIDHTPWLDWLLLTKRPENVNTMLRTLGRDRLPANAWIGTTVEDQTRADQRIPELLEISATVRFLSCEPLLGPLDIRHIRRGHDHWFPLQHLHWIIAGGESGPKARPSHPDWLRSLRDQCQAAGIPYFFKQWGEFAPRDDWQFRAIDDPAKAGQWTHHVVISSTDRRREGQPRLYAHDQEGRAILMEKVGKKAAGRLLDGIEWSQTPAPATTLAQGSSTHLKPIEPNKLP